MSIRMRHTRSHTKNRRSHHKAEEPRLSSCKKCGVEHLSHRACLACGTYNGREVLKNGAQTASKKTNAKNKE